MIIKNINIVTDTEVLNNYYIQIENEKIKEVRPMHQYDEGLNIEVIDGAGKYALPGAIDVHIHGAKGFDTMDATSEAIDEMSKHLPSTGVTTYFPTTMTETVENITRALENISVFKREYGAKIGGVHLEGPFISERYPGAQDKNKIIKPDIKQFDAFFKASGENIKLMTIAPENPGALDLVKHAQSHDVISSVGHSNATYHECNDGFAHGLTHVTHLYNASRGLHHREPGVVGFGMISNAYVELLADGIHSSPEMMHFAFKTIGSDRMIIITDAMRAQSMPEGEYDLGGQTVLLKGHEARLEAGNLAGSVLTMDQGIRNMVKYCDCSMNDIAKMTAYNPAKEFGLNDIGAIEVDKIADIVLYDSDLKLTHTIINGELFYEA